MSWSMPGSLPRQIEHWSVHQVALAGWETGILTEFLILWSPIPTPLHESGGNLAATVLEVDDAAAETEEVDWEL